MMVISTVYYALFWNHVGGGGGIQQSFYDCPCTAGNTIMLSPTLLKLEMVFFLPF